MASSSGMYGMIGIGIAAAVGFVFALSLLSNSGIVGDGGQTPEEFQRESTTSEEDATSMMELNDEGQASMKTTGNESSGGMLAMQAPAGNLSLTLASLVVLNTQREVVREVSEGMEFNAGEGVFVQGNLYNPHDTELSQQGVSLAIVKSENEAEPEGVATFNGAIPAGGSVALDLYWKPGAAGNYTIVLTSDSAAEPIASVQVSAVG